MTFIIHIHDKLSRKAGFLAVEKLDIVPKAKARTFSSLEAAKAVCSKLPTSRDYVASVHIGSF